jgi:3-hydroxybutyryl-CoA dehydrogenase
MKNINLMIAGSGKMGTDLFFYFLPYTEKLFWLCQDEVKAVAARELFDKRIKRQLRAGLLNTTEYEALQAKVIISHQIQLFDADLLIEAITENAEDKRSLFDRLYPCLPETTLITSNTSSIPPEQIFTNPARRAHSMGLHFFYPLMLKNILEINRPAFAAESAVEQLKQILHHCERSYIELEEAQHFLLNRLLLDAQEKAMELHLKDGYPIEEIDTLVRKQILPLGIFEFFDHVGIDVMLQSVTHYDAHFKTSHPCLMKGLSAKVGAGLLGLKTSGGFYSQPHDFSGESGIADESQRSYIVNSISEALKNSYLGALAMPQTVHSELDAAIEEYWGEIPLIYRS